MSTTDTHVARRDRIVIKAAWLFNESGFAATSIDEIGAAAGISGPGVYRHFASKQQVLDQALLAGTARASTHVREALRGATTPRERLQALASSLAEEAVDHPEIVALFFRERRNLSPEARAEVERSFRLYIEEWVCALSEIRSDLAEAEVRTAVHGAIGVALSIAQYNGGLDRRRITRLVEKMTLGAAFAALEPSQ